jgi:AcrR family transcriptional regulator
MPSRSSIPGRRSPQQDRSTRRVTAILEVAEELFAESGFEATTMTTIAERAGSSIGALYSYFPDKKVLAVALLDTYAGKMEAHWKPLFDEITKLSAKEFSAGFMDRFLDFLAANPAYLQLQAAPIRLRRSAGAKRAFRATFLEALRRRQPKLSLAAAEISASVVLQLVRGMVETYAAAGQADKALVVQEFKRALTAYVKTVFSS